MQKKKNTHIDEEVWYYGSNQWIDKVVLKNEKWKKEKTNKTKQSNKSIFFTV